MQNGPLRALQNGGVYVYGASAFPSNTWVFSNYWVDVVFEPKATTSTVTDDNGKYLFAVPGGATCTVWIDPATAPPDCNRVIPECPTVREGITVGPGESFLDADFCLAPPRLGEIGDTVFCDFDEDGFQDPNEPGLPGVTVNLHCVLADGSVVTDSAVTDANGNYLFTDLEPGICTVSVDPSTAPPDCNRIIPECPTEIVVDLGPGESFLDADFCFAPCDLQIEAFCEIPRAPGDGDDCDGSKVTAITIQYTAEDCSATSHTQDASKVDCEDFGALPASVYMVVSDENDAAKALVGDAGKLYYAGPASTAAPIDATAAAAGETKYGSETYIHIFEDADGPLLQEVRFHTSCSQDLAVDNQFGASLIVGLSFEDGRTVTLPDPDPVKDCEIPLTPGVICPDGDDIYSIDFLYTQDDCSATSHGQKSDKVDCDDFGALLPTVWVVVSDEDKPNDALEGKGRTYFEGSVDLNDLFTATAANAGESKFSSDTYIHTFVGSGGGLLQTVKFHTSCSQPLTTADQFGAFAIFGAETKDAGSVSEGTTITFTYEVSNLGASTLNDVVVTDLYGEVDGSPIASLGPDETVTLTRVVVITEDTVNEVTASSGGGACEDSDTTTVTLIPPPPGPIECTAKIQAMLLTYIGPNLAGPVEVVFDPASGPNVVYNLPGGLSTGDTLSKPDQNGFTIDATAAGGDELGSKVIVFIDGVDPDSGIHTSCSAPFIAGQPAPLNDPKGDPSPNWFVEQFTQQ